MMMRINKEKQTRLMQLDFAIWETALFLDSHPESKQALNYYKKLTAMRDDARKSYTADGTPVTHSDCAKGDRWTWTDGPWPWQNEV